MNLATRTVFRQKGSRQKQVLGLTNELKQKLISAYSIDLQGLRDRSLIAVGYDTLWRLEIVGHGDAVYRAHGGAEVWDGETVFGPVSATVMLPNQAGAI